jgi:regulatory protein
MPDAYLDALKMLARRELSEAQIRQRLARRRHGPDAVDRAIARLREERAIDDERVAQAIARTQSSLRRRGKLRARREIEAAGIARSVADRAVDQAFKEVDSDALLDAAVARRLRGRATIANRAELAKLYQYLVRQGFEPDRVLNRLKLHKGYENHEGHKEHREDEE